MAARRYEKYFRSERSERVKCFHHKKRNFVSLRGHVLFCFKYYINTTQNTKPFYFFIRICSHSEGDLFDRKYVCCSQATCRVVKITCELHVRRYHVFARKLTSYFIGVYIIKFNRPFARWRH